MTPREALSIIQVAHPLFYIEKKNGEMAFKPSRKFARAVNAVELLLMNVEGIGEVFGVDIFTLFKALRDGIWVRRDDLSIPKYAGVVIKASRRKDAPAIMHLEPPSLNLRCEEGGWVLAWLADSFKCSDYGKTWSLNGEEFK